MANDGQIGGEIRSVISISGDVSNRLGVVGEVQKGQASSGMGVVMKTKEEWALLPQVVSVKGVFYVYTNWREVVDPDTGTVTYIPRLKIGDGTTFVVDLPFSTMSITDADIERWNDHVGAIVDPETNSLIFYH